MTFVVHGLPVARGIAIGRAVLVASSRVEVVHDFIEPDQVLAELARLRTARDAVAAELQRMQREMPKDAPTERTALRDLHLLLLQDDTIGACVR